MSRHYTADLEIALRIDGASRNGGRSGAPFADDVSELHVVQRSPDDDHEVDSWLKEIASRAEGFTHESLGPIPRYGDSYLARSHDAEPSHTQLIPGVKQKNEVGECDATSCLLNRFELPPLSDALGRIEAADGARAGHYFS